MTTNSFSVGVIVTQIIVISIIFRIESCAECQDENDLKTLSKTTAVGSSVELACNVTSIQFVSWLREDQGIALGSSVYPKWRHTYSVRTVSITNISNYFVYNLVVHNVTEDVEGLYECSEQGCTKTIVNLFVEVPPVLGLEREHSNISNIINVTLNQETDIRCKAVGGKPNISLSWEINGKDETDGVTSETAPNEVSSILNYRPNRDDRMVTCKTGGQMAVPSLRTSVHINVLYPPTCHILVHNDSSSTYKVTCVCVANPAVSSSRFIVNDLPYDQSNTISLPVTLFAKIYCRAENGVGVYETPMFIHTPAVTATVLPIETDQTLEEKSTAFLKSPWSIVLVILITIIITALVVAIIIKKISSTNEYTRKAAESQSTSPSTFDQTQPVSKYELIDTSERKYETHIFREEITANNLSRGGTESTGGKAAEGETPEYLEILDENAGETSTYIPMSR